MFFYSSLYTFCIEECEWVGYAGGGGGWGFRDKDKIDRR